MGMGGSLLPTMKGVPVATLTTLATLATLAFQLKHPLALF